LGWRRPSAGVGPSRVHLGWARIQGRKTPETLLTGERASTDEGRVTVPWLHGKFTMNPRFRAIVPRSRHDARDLRTAIRELLASGKLPEELPDLGFDARSPITTASIGTIADARCAICADWGPQFSYGPRRRSR